MKRYASTISLLSSPFLFCLGTILILTASQQQLPGQSAFWYATLLCLLLLPPLAYILIGLHFGKVGDIHVANKDERTGVYLAAIGGSAAAIPLLISSSAPLPLIALCTQSVVAGIVFMIITRYWKISGHSGGVAAAAATLGLYVSPHFFWLLGLLPAIIWSRIVRGRHTLAQGIVGAILGFCIPLLIGIIFP